MKVKVTQEDIQHGERESMEACPIGQALRRRYAEVRVCVNHVFLDTGRTGQIVALPKEAQRFIQRFDAKRDVKPFTFDLRLS